MSTTFCKSDNVKLEKMEITIDFNGGLVHLYSVINWLVNVAEAFTDISDAKHFLLLNL